jgi:hypothetical protein
MGLTAPWGAAARHPGIVQLMRHCPVFLPVCVFRPELIFGIYFQFVIDHLGGSREFAYRSRMAQDWDIFLQAFAQYPKVCTICH